MSQLRYSQDELMSDVDCARPQVIGGRRMHGGFDADGRYVPPRSKGRNEALDAWTRALRACGGE